MRIAALQTVSSPDLEENLGRARSLLLRAAEKGAELAVLPEHFALLGHHEKDKLKIKEAMGGGRIQDFLSQLALELKLCIVGGTLPLSTDRPERAFNTSLAYSADGQCLARYDKIHLFSFDNGQEHFNESRVIEPGRSVVTFSLPSRDGQEWRIGMSVCYDIRFPELYRECARAGAHLLLVPSSFTYTTGKAHWEPLMRARAIENLCYLAAPAQGGRHGNGRQTWGHSMVVDPWGRILQVLPEGEGVVMADLDMAELEKCRSQLPALDHRVL